MSANLLGNETSPYLLQHKDNPVHWRSWDRAALDLAKQEDKPILLSIGYSACHWCHVMAHESFEDDAIAALMNEHFVNIKVDREERPDLDSIYQTSLALLGQHGGWPLTMFLTPDGEPFWGGTYFPSTAMYGRPGFPDILIGISDSYRGQREKVAQNVEALRDALDKMAATKGGDGLTMDLLDDAARGALGLVDPLLGGTAGAPKFPQPSFFKFLWRAYRRTGAGVYREAVTITLDNLCQGGIYDHLGGAFARYSTDDRWLAPHFEKMLYDNALLIELLAEAWRDTGNPLYAVRIRETVDWALRAMKVGDDVGEEGAFAFASAFDADSEGEEGKFYVWDAAEVDALLGDAAGTFKKAYDVKVGGNWEGHSILNRSHNLALGDAAAEAVLANNRALLFETRAKRVPPGKDDKALTDWNGLMIAGLAEAGATFGETSWIDAAETAFAFVRKHMTRDGRLLHTWCAGDARHGAVLDDYADMARAALVLAEVTGINSYTKQARDWVAIADAHYWDGDGGGYFFTPDDADDLITRSKTAHDNAVPSGNGIMVEVLARLFHVTGDIAYRDRALAVIAASVSESPNHLINQPTTMIGYELLEQAVQVVVVGAPDDEATQALAATALTSPTPTRILTRLAPDEVLPDGHPAAGKGQVGGVATAYVCIGQTCGLPVTDPAALAVAMNAGA
jgi:uncharacterized protein YyaL (SSP411 family)